MEILNRFRGEMAPEQFFSLLLRMIDSNKISGSAIGKFPKPRGDDFLSR